MAKVKPAINGVLKVVVHYWKYHRLNNQHLVETVGEKNFKKEEKVLTSSGKHADDCLSKSGMNIIRSLPPETTDRPGCTGRRERLPNCYNNKFLVLFLHKFFFSLSKTQPILFILFCFIFYRCGSS